MKVLIVLSALALAVFAAEEKTQEKRGLLGLGYGYHDALAAPVAYAAPAYAAPVAKLGLGYAGYAAPAIAPIAKLGYAGAPIAYAAAPVAKLGYAGFGYAPSAYAGYAPAAYGAYAPAAYGYAAPALAAPIAKVGYAGIGAYGGYNSFDLGYGHGLYH